MSHLTNLKLCLTEEKRREYETSATYKRALKGKKIIIKEKALEEKEIALELSRPFFFWLIQLYLTSVG